MGSLHTIAGKSTLHEMTARIARASLLIAAIALAGCNGTLEDIAPKAEKRLPDQLTQTLRARGMAVTSPIMVRIFKEESTLEVWKQKENGRYDLAASYDICKWSGKLGPKFTEGDRQAPEGFYTVRPHQMNPKSQYHLSFNIGFPNAYDRAHGRTGQHLMVHGACSSAGCYSMTDEQVEQIYAFARDAFRGGQTEFQIQAFPFRMTAANMARYRDDPNFEFWKMLKEGYDHFEITRVPPKVDVCGRRYVFNQQAEGNRPFVPTQACPAMSQPETLQTAYQRFQTTYTRAFQTALEDSNGRISQPSPTIAGLKEAALVADWSRRRSRGEAVTREPPSLDRPQIMMADLDREPVLATRVAVVPSSADQARAQAFAPVTASATPSGQATASIAGGASTAPTTEATAAAEAETDALSLLPAQGLRSRITGGLRNLFGG